MLETILFAAYSFALAGGFYYLGHRGISGVRSDIMDVKNDVEKLKKNETIVPPSAGN